MLCTNYCSIDDSPSVARDIKQPYISESRTDSLGESNCFVTRTSCLSIRAHAQFAPIGCFLPTRIVFFFICIYFFVSRRCQGIATQDKDLMAGLHVDSKALRVKNYQVGTLFHGGRYTLSLW